MDTKIAELETALELLIDGHTLASIVNALGRICEEKAEHVRSVWQDKALAKEWTHDARVLSRFDIYN